MKLEKYIKNRNKIDNKLDMCQGIVKINFWDLEGNFCNGDTAITVCNAVMMDTEDIFGRGKRFWESKRAKKRAVLLTSFLKSQSRDFLGC